MTWLTLPPLMYTYLRHENNCSICWTFEPRDFFVNYSDHYDTTSVSAEIQYARLIKHEIVFRLTKNRMLWADRRNAMNLFITTNYLVSLRYVCGPVCFSTVPNVRFILATWTRRPQWLFFLFLFSNVIQHLAITTTIVPLMLHDKIYNKTTHKYCN